MSTAPVRPHGAAAFAVIALPLALCACLPDTRVPPEAHLKCVEASQCPPLWRCSFGRCFAPAVETVPPGLAGPPAVQPEVGTLDTVFRVVLRANEPLGLDPEAFLGVGEARRPMPARPAEDGAWAFEYPTRGDEPPGAVPVSVRLVDASGNLADGVGAGFLRFDFTRPALVPGSALVEPAVVRPGVAARVRFAVNEELPRPPQVQVGELPAAPAAPGPERTWEYAYTPGTDVQGELAVVARFADEAGNRSGDQPLGKIVVDARPPVATLAAPLPERPLRAGELATVALALSEPALAAAPVVLAKDGRTLELQRVAHSALAETHFVVVPPGDDGEWQVRVPAFADAAGNRSAPFVAETLRFDTEAPALAGDAAASLGASHVRTGGRVAAGFATREPGLAVEVLLRLADGRRRPLEQESVEPAGAGSRFVFAGEAADGDSEGEARIEVFLRDAAGNPGGPWVAGPVFVDRTPPRLEPADVVVEPDSPVGLGAQLRVVVTSNEALGSARLVVPGLEPGPALVSGRTALWTHVVTGLDASAPYDLAVTVGDLAGNETPLQRAGAFVLDTQAPAVLPGAAVGPSPAKAETLVTATFDTSEEPADDPVATLDGLTMTRQPGSGATRHVYARAVPSGGSSRAAAVVVSMADSAGNSTTTTLGTVAFDFDPPRLTAADVTASPSPAGIGSVLVVRARAKEALASAEPLQVRAPAGLAFDPPLVAGAVATWTRSISAGELPRALPLDVTLAVRDLAGNRFTLDVDGVAVVDATAPGLAAQPAAAVPDKPLRDGARLEVRFSPDEPLGREPVVVVAGTPLRRAPDAPGHAYVFARAIERAPAPVPPPGQTPAPDAEGSYPVLATLTDAAGNAATVSLGTVTFDFTPPRVSAASVAYVPAADNPLPAVARAKAGTTVVLTAVADERLDAALVPRLRLDCGGVDAASDLAAARTGDGSATFEAPIPAGLPAGEWDCTPWISWRDAAGNLESAATFASPAVRVKTSAPTLAVAQAQVTWVRSPRGNEAAEMRGDYEIPAGAWFGLAPGDPLSGDAALAADTFALADGGSEQGSQPEGGSDDATGERGRPTRVRVWADAARESLLGTLAPDRDDGTWPRRRLANLDAPAAWVTALDDAGNESAPVLVERAEWIATPRLPDTSPHRLAATTVAVVSRTPDGAGTSAAPAGGEGADGQAMLARAQSAWRERTGSERRPSARAESAMAWDAARGRVVLFGGNDSSYRQDTWEWDGEAWAEVFPPVPRPPARSGHAMAWDGARGRVVLFGGSNGTPAYLADLWEWDGARWTERKPAGARPGGRFGASLAWDAARARIVLFGGNGLAPWDTWPQDTWEWDGTRWVQSTADPRPPPRQYAALAWDAARARIVLFGGYYYDGTMRFRQDVWEWNGSAWSDRTPAGTKPAGRSGHVLAYDPVRRQILLHGGGNVTNNANVYLADVWAWNGEAWTARTPAAAPAARGGHAAAWDGTRGRLVVFGGRPDNTSVLGDTWEWDGAAFEERRLSTAAPPARYWHALAFDGGRGRVVLFGGAAGTASLQDTWEWDGRVWTERSPATRPAARQQHAMAYDSARGRVVLFGGRTAAGAQQDTWEWDGTTWQERATAGTRPAARTAHALAFDSARGRVVLFGGNTASSRETWEWDGAVWAQRSPAAQPGARLNHAMAYDSARGRVVLFGGASYPESTVLGDTWEWDGTLWMQRAPAASPPAREDAGLAFDAARGRTVLFGGSGGGVRQDAWEWDGSVWTERTPATEKPRPRSRPGLAWDAARQRLFLFGGMAGGGSGLGDSWEWDAGPERRPAFQFEATGGFEPADVTGLRVRAHCGGRFSPFGAADVGAALLGWATGGDGRAPGAWLELTTNAAGAGATAPYLPAPPAALLDWTAPSAEEARRFVAERDRLLAFQCRPAGPSGAADAAVALDYVEVRVRYRAR